MDTAGVKAELELERTAVAGQREQLQRDLEVIFAATADVATDDEHDPEGATIAYERSRTTALIDRADEHLAEISLALERLAAGTYGVCERCGNPIADERLAARPAVRTCIACATR